MEQDRDSDKYQLGAGLLQLGNSYLDLNELRGRSIVHAERLAERTDAAVRVGVMHGATVVVVHHVFRPDTTLQILEVGAELPVHASALGKAILAFAPGELLDDLLAETPPKLTSRTLTPAALREGARRHARERRSPASATRRCWASRAWPARSSTTPATRSAASAWWATPSASSRAGRLAASRRAVAEAARGDLARARARAAGPHPQSHSAVPGTLRP